MVINNELEYFAINEMHIVYTGLTLRCLIDPAYLEFQNQNEA
jgi:hypothetical protein